MLNLAIFLTLFSYLLAHKSFSSSALRYFYSFLFFLSLLACSFAYIVNRLTGDSFNDAFYYHLNEELGQAGISDFSTDIIISILLIIFSFITTILITTGSKNSKIKSTGFKSVFSFGLLALALFINPSSSAIMDIAARYNSSPYHSNDYTAPDEFIKPAKMTENESPKNLIYLYLESLEYSYFDSSRFPDLLPHLSRFAKKSHVFTNIHQAEGTGWTIAGMVASQCGLPLAIKSNAMGNIDRFLPGATCLGDLLAEQGYALSYLGGASLEFAGKGRFYQTHGFSSVQGRKELIALLDDPTYLSSWGLYDDSLLDIAARHIEQKSMSDRPFAQALLTLDTHHPKGHLSRECDDIVYQDGANPILNAVHCADKLVGQFINRLEKRGLLDQDTVLVIASDHLAMPNTATNLLERGPRRNLLMIHSTELKPGKDATFGTTVDIAPTLLTVLGYPIKSLGFGRSLLGSDTERFKSVSELNTLFADNYGFIQSLWGFPNIGDGLEIQPSQQRIMIGKREIGFPAMLVLDESNHVHSVRFPDQKTLIEKASRLDLKDRFLAFDYCKSFNDGRHSFINKDHLCVAAGSYYGSNLKVTTIEKNHLYGSDILLGLIPDHNQLNQGNLKLSIESNLLNGIEINITSKNKDTISNIKNSLDKTPLKEGFTLFSVSENQTIKEHLHLSACSPKNQQHSYNIRNTVEKIIKYSDRFILTFVPDSSCNLIKWDERMANLFEGSGLEEWREIGPTKPYIAIASFGELLVEDFYALPQQALTLSFYSQHDSR